MQGDDPSITEPVSVSGFDQSRSAFDDNIPPSQSNIDQSAIDDPSVTDNTIIDDQNKEDKDKPDASKTSVPGSDDKTGDLSANAEESKNEEKPQPEKKKGGGCCSKKKKKEIEENELQPLDAEPKPAAVAVEEKPKPKGKNRQGCCGSCLESSLCYYIFWYFDGINLLGYRNHHQPTPHSGTPKCCDSRKFLWLIWVTFVICLSFSIYNIETRKLGSIRVQTNEISQEPMIDIYPVNEVLPLHATQYLNTQQLAYELGRKDVLGRPDGFPTQYSQYTESQKEWLKNYLCSAVKVSYVEVDTFDEAGSTNTGKFQFDCSVYTLLEDYHQLHFQISVNTEGDIKETDALTGLTLYQGNTRNIQFKRTSNFKQGILVEYGTDIVSVEGKFALYHSEIEADLGSSESFSEFLDHQNTTALVHTPIYKIGVRPIDKALVRVTPTVIIDEAKVVDKRVFGIPNSWMDVNKTVLLFEKNSNVDIDGRLPLLTPQKGSADLAINIDFDVNYFQKTQKNQYFSILDLFVQLGGAWMFFQLLFGLFTPFIVISFLTKLAGSIKDKRTRLYREGLEHLFGKTVGQLGRIKELTQTHGGWEFITSEQLQQIDTRLELGQKADTHDSILPYQSEMSFTHDALYTELKSSIMLIHEIQLETAKRREVFVSNEIQFVNEHRKPRYPNQRTEVEVHKRPDNKGRRKAPIDSSQSPPVLGPLSQAEMMEHAIREKMKSSLSKAMDEQRESLKDNDNFNNSFVGLSKDQYDKQLVLNRRREGVSDFHYRRTAYDINFAVSITDEIMDLEPLEEKLIVLKRNQEMTLVQVITQMRQRLTFFGLFNLFDTVHLDKIDNQALIQKLLLHIKRQDNELTGLKRTVVEIEPLLFMLEDENYDKLVGLIENGETGRVAEVELSAAKSRRSDQSYINKSTFTNIHVANEQMFDHLKMQIDEHGKLIDELKNEQSNLVAGGGKYANSKDPPIDEEADEGNIDGKTDKDLPRGSQMDEAGGDQGDVDDAGTGSVTPRGDTPGAEGDTERKKKKKDKKDKKDKKKKKDKERSRSKSKKSGKSAKKDDTEGETKLSQKSVEQEGGYKEREYDVISSKSTRGRHGRSKSKTKKMHDLDAEGGEQIQQEQTKEVKRLKSRSKSKLTHDQNEQKTDRALLR